MKSAGRSSLLFPCSIDFHHLLTTFANSLDLDQDQHFVGPDLDPSRTQRSDSAGGES